MRLWVRASEALVREHGEVWKANGDVPEVEAVIGLIETIMEDAWRTTVSGMMFFLESELERLREDNRTEEDIAKILASLVIEWDQAHGLDYAAVVQLTERLLLAAIDYQPYLELDARLDAHQTLTRGAYEDLALLLLGHATYDIGKATLSIKNWLGTGAVGNPTILDTIDTTWMNTVADLWAYRWFTLGGAALIAQEADPEAVVIAVNNPPAGPDARTTPFCRSIHNRVIGTVRSVQTDVQEFLDALDTRSIDAAAQAWPLLTGDEAKSAASGPTFSKVLLPPYHWRCRTQIRLAAQPRRG